MWLKDTSTEERKTLIAAFAGFGTDAFDYQIYPLLIPTLIAAWSMTNAQAGSIATGALITSALGGWAAGVLADKYGRVRMLLASISLVQPALARIFLRWPVFAGLDDILWAVVSQLVFVLALGLYDLVSRKRVHSVTLLGGLFFMGAMLVSTFLIATSEAGRAFVRGLG